jgi:hypothetical protein
MAENRHGRRRGLSRSIIWLSCGAHLVAWSALADAAEPLGSPSRPATILSSATAASFGILPRNPGRINTARLQRAIHDGAQQVVFDRGVYHFDGTITIVRRDQSLDLGGQGEFFGTRLVQDDPTADFFHFGSASLYTKGFHLHDLAIAQAPKATGGKVIVSDNTYGLVVERASIDYCDGIDTFNSQAPTFTDLDLVTTCQGAKSITGRGTGNGYNMYITRVRAVGPTCSAAGQSEAGMYFENFDGVFATDSQFNCTGKSLEFAPTRPAPGTQSPNFLHFWGKDLSLNMPTHAGIYYKNTGGYTYSVHCMHCEIDGSYGDGIYSEPGVHSKGLELTDFVALVNAGSGAYFHGPIDDISINGGRITGNSTMAAAEGRNDGIRFGDGTFDHVSITNTTIGSADNYPASQGYGISAANGAGATIFRFSIFRDNILDGNATGAFSSSFLSSTFIGGRDLTGNQGFPARLAGTFAFSEGETRINVDFLGGAVLPYTPTPQDISLTPTSSVGTGTSPFVSRLSTSGMILQREGASLPGLTGAWQLNYH